MKNLIALFLPSLRGGGAERAMMKVANGIAACGFKVDMVLTKAEGPYLQDVAPTVRIIDLNSHHVLNCLPALIRYLRREQPVVLLSVLNHANVIALLARIIACAQTRVVVSERNNLSESQASVPIGRAKMLPWLMRLLYPRADRIVAVSSGVADDLARTIALPRERIDVIYNAVVTEALLDLSRQSNVHPWLKEKKYPVILAVGRLTEQKDFRSLINAFAIVRKNRKLRLIILGEGNLRIELENLVFQLNLDADVALPGFIYNPYSWMRNSSLFVLSSAWEGLPAVLIEAMVCGTPVVSTDCRSGPAEILENGKWGRLVPVGDARAMASAIEKTLDEIQHPDVALRAHDFGEKQSVMSYLKVLGIQYD